MYHGAEFPGVIIPFGCLVYYKPPNTSSNDSGKWDPDARKGIFAGCSMRSVHAWGKAYLVWDLESFRSSDLRTCASHKHQRIGIPQVSGRCELPADGSITFPLKSHYDAINVDIFHPFLIESDPQDGEEEDQDAIRARAPQDLDARIPPKLPSLTRWEEKLLLGRTDLPGRLSYPGKTSKTQASSPKTLGSVR